VRKLLCFFCILWFLPFLPGAERAWQGIDEEYRQKIREYTTEPFFNSPWTDYLPASKNVPTPNAALGGHRRRAKQVDLFF
jgi:hypothetical protein